MFSKLILKKETQMKGCKAFLATLIVACTVCTGCSHLYVCNTTKEGRTFEAYAWSFLWDRNLTGMTFDYEKGTLGLAKLNSTPDKETIAKGMELIKAGTALVGAGAL